uniref:Uncharacterized protein n=1 Tax=Arundo donax TaxID=35708 RepID=A0A0A9GP67_ARUDO
MQRSRYMHGRLYVWIRESWNDDDTPYVWYAKQERPKTRQNNRWAGMMDRLAIRVVGM